MSELEKFMDTTLKNLKSMVDVNTVIGDAVTAPDGTVIIPVSTVGFGFGAGGSDFVAGKTEACCFGGGSGGGVSIKPTAFLIVGNGTVRLLPVSNSSSSVDKIIDLVPEMIQKVNNAFSDMSEKHRKKKNETSEEEEVQTVNVIDLDE